MEEADKKRAVPHRLSDEGTALMLKLILMHLGLRRFL